MADNEDLTRAHIALETAGSISGAAKLLGHSDSWLKNLIRDNPELQSYLPNAAPPSEAEVFAGPKHTPVPAEPRLAVTREQEEFSKAVKGVNKQIRDGFAGMGINGKALDQAIAFRDFGRDHFKDMRELTGGGQIKVYLDLIADIQETRDLIKGADPDDVELQRMLREDRSRMVKLALETHATIAQAQLTVAMIEAKKREALESKRSKGAPAFAPLMKVEGNVTINEAKPPEPTKQEAPAGAS